MKSKIEKDAVPSPFTKATDKRILYIGSTNSDRFKSFIRTASGLCASPNYEWIREHKTNLNKEDKTGLITSVYASIKNTFVSDKSVSYLQLSKNKEVFEKLLAKLAKEKYDSVKFYEGDVEVIILLRIVNIVHALTGRPM